MGNVVDGIMFPAPAPTYSRSTPGLPLVTVDGVPCLWYPHPRAEGVILYLHGNGADLGMLRGMLHNLRNETRRSVLAVEYPGYGVHVGSPTPAGAVAAARKAYDHLVRKYGARRLLVIGRSIGTGVSLEMLRDVRRQPAAVVLISPFRSMEDMGWHMAGSIGGSVTTGVLDSVRNVAALTAPLLVIHGAEDRFIPIEQAREIYAASPAARKDMRVLHLSDHNQLEWQLIFNAILTFVRRK